VDKSDRAEAARDGEYTARAILRSLRELMRNANFAARTRNNICVETMPSVSYMPFQEAVGNCRSMGAVVAFYRVIDAAQREPAGTHTFAILEVLPGAMERFTKMLAYAKDQLPIVASWRPVAGNPDLVIDLWTGDIGRDGYRPSDDRTNAFFGPLREIAPRERLVRLSPLPYSPLQ